MQAIDIAALIFEQARERGYNKMNLQDIGGGFPATYDLRCLGKLFSELPANLERGDLLYSKNIGAYSGATST